MKLSSLTFAVILTFLSSCKQRESNESTSFQNDKETQPKGRVSDPIQVEPKAFNAFDLWSKQKGRPILQYPTTYLEKEGKAEADGVFYVSTKDYWDINRFLGIPILEARIRDNTLEYPMRGGAQLKLKFSKVSENAFSHQKAREHCEESGMRLPTIRELFDFCAAEVKEPKYGPQFTGKYPPQGRCSGVRLWSASLDSDDVSTAWYFAGAGRLSGHVDTEFRVNEFFVRCVLID